MIQIDKTQFRNLEEQVQFLTNYHDVNQALIAWGIRVVGIKETEDELPLDYTGDYGDAYAVGTAAPYDFYIWTRAAIVGEQPYWFPFGQISIVGPAGPQGIQGPVGPEGESSKWYVKNITGTPRENDQLLDTEGNVYTLIKKEDDSLNWELQVNIRGPQGIQGPRGPQGEKGDTGDIGPQGPRGDVGGLVNIRGTVSNIQQLPTPESLQNLTVAYLVGTQEPYRLYIQIGDTPETAMWEDVGPINTATLVYVNGEAQNIWDADTKLDKDTTAKRLYGTDAAGNPFMYRYDSDVSGNAIVRRTIDGQIRCADPHPNHKEDVVTVNYLRDNTFYFPNITENSVIPVKNNYGTFTTLNYSTNNTGNSISQRNAYGQLLSSKAPILGTTTANSYSDVKVATMGNLYDHSIFSTQIRKFNSSSLTQYKSLYSYGVYEFYIPEGSIIYAGAYAVSGITTNTKIAVSGGILKIIYTETYMIIEGRDMDNDAYESYFVLPTDGSYGKYALEHNSVQPLYVKIDLFPPTSYTIKDIGTVPTYS